MFSEFRPRRRAAMDDPATSHRFWDKAKQRAAKLSAGQADEWMLAILGHSMRLTETWRTAPDTDAVLDELETGAIGQLALVREWKRRLAREEL
jgi:hypothetical protein